MELTLRTVSTWFLLFVLYSFLGWIIEIIVTGIENRKLGNRGFLIGPICPIYGVGATIFSFLISPDTNWFIIFCTTMVCSAILEYLTSLIMEKLFHARWWDYSKEPFNLNGRICLRNLIGFGILGVLVIRLINPFVLQLSGLVPSFWLFLVAGITLAVLVIDIMVSLKLIIDFRVTVGVASNGDATSEIKERVHEIIMGKKGRLNHRLEKAFPSAQPKKIPPRKKTVRSTKTTK